MRKKLLAFISAVLMLMYSMPVYAYDSLPIAHSNSYVWSKTGGGHLLIPYLSLQITL